MKKQQLDHVLRAAGRITGENQFAIIGSQSLHGITQHKRLLALLDQTAVSAESRDRIRKAIAADFAN